MLSELPNQTGGLTKTQMRVLQLVGDGLETKEIAYKMKTSPKTIEYHRAALNRIFRFSGGSIHLARLAIAFGMSALCLMCMTARGQFLVVSNPAPVVQLAWNPSSDSMVVAYSVYYGVGSGQYTNVTRLGNVTNAEITLPARGVRFYFAVTASTSTGLESVFSNEVNYSPANPPAPPTQKPLTVLTVMKSTSPDGVFADAGMSWSDAPSDTASFYKLKIDRGVMLSLAPPPVPK
jgi:DNA-binding CsgD family transcriptional regulator